MSPKSGLVVAATTLAALAISGVVIIGNATGGDALRASPPPAFTGDLPGAAAPAALPAKPQTTLHLPTALHFVSQDTNGAALDSTHNAYTAVLAHPSSAKKIIGTAAYSCAGSFSTNTATCNGGLALHDGALLFDYTETLSNATLKGKIVGGSGFYAGAHGTLSGHDNGNGRSTLNIHYNFG